LINPSLGTVNSWGLGKKESPRQNRGEAMPRLAIVFPFYIAKKPVVFP
jgi:hypothetical protein